MTSDRTFRTIVGLASMLLSAIGLGLLFFVEVPPGNREALLLALGIVFGWGGAVVQSEFGSTSSGRTLAQTNAKVVEKIAAVPAGTPADPVNVKDVAEG